MKHKQTSRQLSALERTLRSIEGYKKILKGTENEQREMLANVISRPKLVETMTKDEIRKVLKDKLTKAEKCVENLEAKGITLEK